MSEGNQIISMHLSVDENPLGISTSTEITTDEDTDAFSKQRPKHTGQSRTKVALKK